MNADALRWLILLARLGLFGYLLAKTFLAGPAVFIPIGVYLALAGVLAVRPPTSGLGAGLLFGLGIFILLGGGICIMALSQMSRQIWIHPGCPALRRLEVQVRVGATPFVKTRAAVGAR
ncbi:MULTISPECIES: hypothetical protein [unclassified Arthrobacter]|uniref:hypothetical protein n=2 Tax=Arthrobacter TaxID=1663 RepID=UPI0012F0D3A1|nr:MULTISPECIES: hypothetical protein [unclassified Arthrobacter]BCW78446.1 hypothetical protein NicSoilC5_04650 [Arthrobacter sp. NicSoilC5]VXC07480.1 hypothetical protein ARTHRO8AJ_420003 [Arthrobacter sp. 8AJ]